MGYLPRFLNGANSRKNLDFLASRKKQKPWTLASIPAWQELTGILARPAQPSPPLTLLLSLVPSVWPAPAGFGVCSLLGLLRAEQSPRRRAAEAPSHQPTGQNTLGWSVDRR